jgi:hypothetical protein
MFPIFAGNSASTGYNLTRSLRTRASASAYLNRTPSVAGNRQVWTWSGWAKRGTLTGDQAIFFAGTAGNNNTLRFNSDNTMYVFRYDGSITWGLSTTQVFRDPSAWYHVVVAYDSTQATSTNRVKLYINGTQVTAFSSATYPSLNLNGDVNNTVDHRIANNNASNNFDGYQTEDVLVDGQALTPSSFGSTNALTGVWQPARYTGTYGTNGFYLPFTDNSALTTSSNVGLGKDFSGNGNYWTTNNISITAGVTYDSMTDVPTLTSATAANYCVANAVNAPTNSTITNGNLTVDGGGSAQYSFAQSTFALTSGTYYFEATLSTATATSNGLGLLLPTVSKNISTYSTSGVYAINWGNSGQISSITNGGTAVTISTTNWVNGNVIQVAYNATNGNIWFGRNGTWYPATNGGTVGDPAANTNPTVVGVSGLTPTAINYGNGTKWDLNFGQRPFSYTPPTGFVALCTYNLPTSTILQGNKVMDATLYTGTLLSNSITNAAAFKPDLVWLKSRSAATNNELTDSVRGVTKALVSNSTAAETTDTQGLTAFNTNGFTVGTNTDYNNLAATYVAWQWQAGQGSTSSNTNGTITSTVSVNASAGFSIATFTGTGAAGTVGHGLGVAPSMYIIKQRSATGDWFVYHQSVGATAGLFLNLTTASTTNTYFNNTSPTSSVFSIGTAGGLNANGVTAIAYCWTPIAGYSAFGSYTGNGSADGPFVYTGFRPRWVMMKLVNSASDWYLFDTARDPYNVSQAVLYPNLSDAEGTFSTRFLDILSNGFKLRTTANPNTSNTIIYMAFAENPFRNALAR